MGKNFSTPLKKHESILGWFYLVIHTFLMGEAVMWANEALGLGLKGTYIDLVYYIIGFVFVLAFMFSFLRKSFSDLCDNFGKTITSVALSYLGYYLLSFVVVALLSLLVPEISNPNQNTINDNLQLNANVMKAVGIFLAPVIEEVLFRGVAFGGIRKKNRIAAYVVSAVLFSVYHLWQYIFIDFEWTTLLYLLQYVPASVMLCWCYERSRNIWGPIFMHMLVNVISLSVNLLI